MAKQRSIIKLEGTLGDITFLKTKDGYLAKEKTSIPAERIASDPAFQRTRENSAEFSRAGKAVKLFRSAFRSSLQNASDKRMSSRLMVEMMKVIKADTSSERGLRNIIDGEAELLEGFEFNGNSALDTTLYAPFIATINRTTGELQVTLASFVPQQMIGAPSGTTHFRIRGAAAEIDFEKETFTSAEADSSYLAWDAQPSAAISLLCSLTANSTHPLFLVLGIEFSQEVNGNTYPLKNGAFNAMAVVKVEGV